MQVLQERCGVSLELTGALDINTIDEIRRVLLDHLERHTDVVVDLSRVDCCDASGAQLLIALEKSAESADKPFSIGAVSDSFVRDCAGIGIHFAASAPQASTPAKPKNHEIKKSRNLAKKRPAKKLVEASNE